MARYFTTDQDGITLIEPDVKAMRAVLAQLESDGVDELDYPEVSLTHRSGWALSVGLNGVVVLEKEADEDNLQYLKVNTLTDVLELWKELAAGHLDRIEQREWIPWDKEEN